ncbi:UNVERIFIED_CONTAM: hypothetical protein FKN15_049820 [Acipenser sinensis]
MPPLFGHLPPYSLKSRLTVPAQEHGQQRAKGGGHGGVSSSHPNNCSVPVDHAQAGSSGQKNFGGGLQTCSPFFMAGSSPPWGSGHPFSCSEIAVGGAGLLTFFMAGSCPSWGSSHSISCSEIAAGEAGLLTSPPFFMAGSCPSRGSSHSISCRESVAGGAGLLTSAPPLFRGRHLPFMGLQPQYFLPHGRTGSDPRQNRTLGRRRQQLQTFGRQQQQRTLRRRTREGSPWPWRRQRELHFSLIPCNWWLSRRRGATGSPRRCGATGSPRRCEETGSPRRCGATGSPRRCGETGSPRRCGETGILGRSEAGILGRSEAGILGRSEAGQEQSFP